MITPVTDAEASATQLPAAPKGKFLPHNLAEVVRVVEDQVNHMITVVLIVVNNTVIDVGGKDDPLIHAFGIYYQNMRFQLSTTFRAMLSSVA